MYICLTDNWKRSIHGCTPLVANIIWQSFRDHYSFGINWEIKIKKLICSVFCFVTIVLTATTYQAKAGWGNFSGIAGLSAEPVSNNTTKTNYEYRSWVDWQTTNFVCKMWFSVHDTSNKSVGKTLVSGTGLGDVSFITDARYGNSYRLWANREHLGNPRTTVSGEWQP